MKKETKPGTCGSARGVTFNPPLEFTFEVNLFEKVEEFREKGKPLTDAEQMKYRNAEEVTRARQAAQNALLDSMGIEKQDANNNDQIRLRQFVNNLMTSPKWKALGKEAAIARGEETLDLVWEGDRN